MSTNANTASKATRTTKIIIIQREKHHGQLYHRQQGKQDDVVEGVRGKPRDGRATIHRP